VINAYYLAADQINPERISTVASSVVYAMQAIKNIHARSALLQRAGTHRLRCFAHRATPGGGAARRGSSDTIRDTASWALISAGVASTDSAAAPMLARGTSALAAVACAALCLVAPVDAAGTRTRQPPVTQEAGRCEIAALDKFADTRATFSQEASGTHTPAHACVSVGGKGEGPEGRALTHLPTWQHGSQFVCICMLARWGY
jgi:hypothetical protein